MTQLPEVPSTDTELTGVRNFRDVGGLPTLDGRRVRFGRLYRSGHLAHASEADTVFLSGLGLHTVFDFRNAADHKLDGYDVELPGVRNVSIPLSDPADGAEFWRLVRDGNIEQLRSILAGGKGTERMIASYRSIITDRTAEHSRVLHALAEDSVPALMHCAAGRTVPDSRSRSRCSPSASGRRPSRPTTSSPTTRTAATRCSAATPRRPACRTR